MKKCESPRQILQLTGVIRSCSCSSRRVEVMVKQETATANIISIMEVVSDICNGESVLIIIIISQRSRFVEKMTLIHTIFDWHVMLQNQNFKTFKTKTVWLLSLRCTSPVAPNLASMGNCFLKACWALKMFESPVKLFYYCLTFTLTLQTITVIGDFRV